MEIEKGKVCVTGGARYFASWLIMRLLQHGYSVSTTVRSDPSIIPVVQYSNLILFHISGEPNHIPFLLISFFLLFILAEFKEDTSHLKALPGAPERLQIFDADLSKPDSFDAAMNGCVGVFHVAHPIIFDAEDPENMVITHSPCLPQFEDREASRLHVFGQRRCFPWKEGCEGDGRERLDGRGILQFARPTHFLLLHFQDSH